jgi:Fe-Mn family superoxide dismutase
MSFTLPELPYAKDALAPHLSAETLDFHHGKHHAAYVNNLNNFAKDDASIVGKSIEELVRTSSGKVFNNAAQVWNHTFYWSSMRPGGGGEPTGAIADAINKSFGSFGAFKEKFSAAAAGHFGSGWAWLVKNGDTLEITDSHDAGCPLTAGQDADPHLRRLGARVLHRLPERARQVHRGVVEPRELGPREQAALSRELSPPRRCRRGRRGRSRRCRFGPGSRRASCRHDG